ncbi:hypothetical protein LCL87_13975 [Rhodococcus hoagii]|nr:hypothetical protein [Prescottella equi]
MKTRMFQRLFSAAVVSAALSAVVVTGAAGPAAALPGTDPLTSIVGSVEGGSSGGVGSSEHLGVDALVAARNAGVPVYEVGRTVIVSATKMGTVYATEYRRVHEVDALESPTTKFVAVGAAAPDNFYVVAGYDNRNWIVVNMRPSGNPVFGGYLYDTTPQSWWNSPTIPTADAGPRVGVAFIG